MLFFAETLGIHPNKINIEYDPENNNYQYTIQDDTYPNIENINNIINTPEFLDDIKSKIDNEHLNIIDMISDNEIYGHINISLPTDDIDNLQDKINNIDNYLETLGYKVQSTSKNIFYI